MTFMSFNAFSDDRKSFRCFHLIHFRKNQSDFVLKLCQMKSFYDLQVSFDGIYCTLAEELDEVVFATSKEKFFAYREK